MCLLWGFPVLRRATGRANGIFQQTISCLLIQPNPDSALNATAGHLLQDDYDSFARQARLMTSIHASIPLDLRDAAIAAKRRGEEPSTTILDDPGAKTLTMKGKSASSSRVIMKKLPQRIISTQSALVPRQVTQEEDGCASEEEDEDSASKENDPMLSPTPVPAQTPRRPTLVKRPLSDLPTPVEPDDECTEASCLSPSDQNVLNHTLPLPKYTAAVESCKVPQLAERSQSVNFTNCGLQDASPTGLAALPADDRARDDGTRPAKRICSDESKENLSAERPLKLPERPQTTANIVSKAAAPAPRKASAPGSLGAGSAKGKARAGLRRL